MVFGSNRSILLLAVFATCRVEGYVPASASTVQRTPVQVFSRGIRFPSSARMRCSMGAGKNIPISLDKPIVPAMGSPGARVLGASLLLLASMVVAARAVAVLSPLTTSVRRSRVLQQLGYALEFVRNDLLPDLGQAIRLKIGQFSAFVEDTREFWRDALREADEEVVDVNDWHVCTVQEREKLGSDYIRYRFKLQGSNCVLPCDIGQEIMLCTVDAEDSVLKEGYICVSPRKARGYFDVVVKRTTEEGTKNKFVRALDLLAIGDEVAYKAGRQRLVYQGDDQEIEALTIVASGAGIAIALHLAQELLPIKDSTVREIEILWLNEKGDDFVLADEMEHLYYKHNRRLKVHCVLEKDLYGHDLGRNTGVRGALTKYSRGHMGVVCGPGYLVEKIRKYLSDRLGYPFNSVVQIKM